MKMVEIPTGNAGTAHTVAAVLGFALDPRSLPELRAHALRITYGARTNHERAARVYSWVRRNVPYVRDAYMREHVQDPIWVLRRARDGDPLAQADCDCHASIVAGLLMALGIRCRLVVTEDPRNQGSWLRPRWAHIYCEALTENGWTPVDTSMWPHPDRPIGFGVSVPASRVTYIYPEDIGSDTVARVARQVERDGSLGGAVDPMSFVSGIITASSKIITSLIGSRAQRKAARFQRDAQIQLISSQERLARRGMELQFAARQLEAERAARLAAQEAGFVRIQSAASRTTNTVIMATILGMAAVVVWSSIRRKR